MTQGTSGLKSAKAVSIDWEPVNWFAATWREIPSLIKTEPRTFDLEWAQANAEECVNKFVIDWLKAPCDMSLSSDEALFWFSSCFGGGLGDLSSLPELSRVARDEGGKIRLEAMKGLLSKTRFEANRAHGLVPLQILDTLMDREELIQLFCDLPTMPTIQTPVSQARLTVPFTYCRKVEDPRRQSVT